MSTKELIFIGVCSHTCDQSLKSQNKSTHCGISIQNLQGVPWSYGRGSWQDFKIEESKQLRADCGIKLVSYLLSRI